MVEPLVLSDDELRAITVPALYVVGENEKLCLPSEAMERLAAVAPSIRTEFVRDAGHDLWGSEAERISEMILGFSGCRE